MKQQLRWFAAVCMLALGVVACGEDDASTKPTTPDSQAISDTLKGNIKGTMKAGKTYYLTADATVLKGDTLKIEPGVKLIDLSNHALIIKGALLAHGSKDSMIYMGPDASRQTTGSWAGILCDSPSVVSLQWCRLDYAGGIRPDGRPRPAIYYFSNAANTSEFYLEDCIIYKPKDDGFMLYGGKGHILRNQFLWNGEVEGSGPNFKAGFKGKIAYNYIWSCTDQCIRVETGSTVLFPQTDVEIYNNTIINSGHKNSSRPGAGVKIDLFSRAKVYNNIMVNTRLGLNITKKADTANCMYGNNLFYTTVDSLQQYFYPADGYGKPQSTDLIQVDPLFVKFNPDMNALTDDNDVHLQAGSPTLGKGNAAYDPDLGCFTAKRDK
ncbi:MAG: right-handed parallel beta-helix repeat-containing protein [Chlorobi bacterium]|nr:MAG: hypothetical protein UZ07_CHB004002137 [Chlorobi bacterium OLB7]MBK8910694.1 right-handed parallel beta-helix repeat-containing protein [Chlorobiota bacterium]MBX7216264.1 right-handed parallel beta-helix repeat-containing protein [Candidatus Kapabacteria bacterium]